MLTRTFIYLLALWFAGPADALQRCVDKAGSVTYSDQVCADNQSSRKVDLSGAGAGSPQPAIKAQPSDSRASGLKDAPPANDRMDAMKEYLAGAARARKRDSLAVDLRNAERTLSNLQESMDAELGRLKAKKGHANNNLAGATWESSISQEMGAITQRYELKIRMAGDRVDRLRTEHSLAESGG